MGRYSNPSLHSRRIQFLLHMTPVGCPIARVPSLQVQHRLSTVEIEKLVDIYQSGRTIEQLAEDFQIHRTTVMAHLRRAGIMPGARGRRC